MKLQLNRNMISFNKKKQTTVKDLEPPKGWYVQQAFQNPLHMLWDVVLVSFDDVINKIEDPRHHIAREKNTYNEGLLECISKCCGNE